MNATRNIHAWKVVTELVGIVAIVLSLLLVLREIRQAKEIALGEFDMAYAGNRILSNQISSAYADIWVRGNANEELNEAEAIIFRNMVVNENDLAYYKVLQASRLGDTITRDVFYADFVQFLHRNPGARRVWIEREESFAVSRKRLAPHIEMNAWHQDVMSGLARLDGAGN